MKNLKYKNRDPILETSGEIVGFYEREFYVFSNFSSFAVEWHGKVWPTAEHAYQASKFFENSPEISDQVYNVRSAHDAQKLAQKYKDKTDSDFYDKNIKILEDICRHKLQQHKYIQNKLIQTGDRKIVEDSPKDDFWGWGADRNGRNELGKIWMKLRQEILT